MFAVKNSRDASRPSIVTRYVRALLDGLNCASKIQNSQSKRHTISATRTRYCLRLFSAGAVMAIRWAWKRLLKGIKVVARFVARLLRPKTVALTILFPFVKAENMSRIISSLRISVVIPVGAKVGFQHKQGSLDTPGQIARLPDKPLKGEECS